MIFILWPNFPNGETEAQRDEVVFLTDLVGEPTTTNQEPRGQLGWGTGMGQLQCQQWADHVWLGPITLGWGQIQATEMTLLQPFSAASFLPSVAVHPLPSSTHRGACTACSGAWAFHHRAADIPPQIRSPEPQSSQGSTMPLGKYKSNCKSLLSIHFHCCFDLFY